jgi:hypothetical protein
MKHIKFPNLNSIYLVIVFSLVFIGCNPDDEDTNTGSSSPPPSNNSYFMNATINGQSYSTNNVVPGGFGGDGCTSQNYRLDNIGQINLANYFLDVNIFRLVDNVDFSALSPGPGNVIDYYDYFYDDNLEKCNFDLAVALDDEQQQNTLTTLNPSGTHTVTSITQVNQSSTDITYAVEGTFSFSVTNSVGAVIPITGNYRIPLDADL